MAWAIVVGGFVQYHFPRISAVAVFAFCMSVVLMAATAKHLRHLTDPTLPSGGFRTKHARGLIRLA